MRVRLRPCLVLSAVVTLVACSPEEEARRIDLSDAGSPASTAPAADAEVEADGGPAAGSLPPTPHAIGDNPQTRALAEEQCRNDPQLEQGVIRIVDPATQAVVGEVVVDCADVRATS